ncbi:hypothetical protein CFK37_03590 [Virgibacillus phasianinus]|uniref:Uncharacterized protein n=1 Tax=Virgibacillus phasianinus TaxID=2017483 RepID=A0A220U0C9_9BACI|nr:hypothetical protein [Virgibacillus phasianinus]ASK61321.1 hypothetical protein CFK37_03590 [Virgibacillus phasianinus]
MSEVAGQIDVKPTLLHLLGVETDNNIYFGNDLFSKDCKGYISLRNGDFISEKYVSTSGICYNRQTGERVEGENKSDVEKETESPCAPIGEKVNKELGYSDDIIYGDLFRFMDLDEME